MANTTDTRKSVDLETVLDAFRGERDYQQRRWGGRQPDGTFIEVSKSVDDFILYMQDYYEEARRVASRTPGVVPALEVLRKVITLGFACLEQAENLSFDTVAGELRLHPGGTRAKDFSGWMLAIAMYLDSAATQATFNPDNTPVLREIVLASIRKLIWAGIDCFRMYGIQPRDVSGGVINARDGQPA